MQLAGGYRKALFLIFLLVAILLVYRNALFVAHVGGDAYTLTYGNALVRSPDGIFRAFGAEFFAGREGLEYGMGNTGYFRPVTTALFWLEYRVAGENDVIYNLDQQLLHWLNACLVFILASMLFPGRGLAPYIATALFALHPVNAFTAVRVDARSDVLFCFFYLASLLCYLSAMQAEERWKKIGGVAAGAALYLCSMMSKEMGATLPMVLVLFHWYWWRRGREPLRQVLWTLPFWASFALYMLLRQAVVTVPPDIYAEYPRLVIFLNVFKGIAIHLLRILLPVGADYRELLPRLMNHFDPTLSEPFLFLSLGLTGALVLLAFAVRRTSPITALCIVFFLVTMTPLFAVGRILGVSNDLGVIPVEERWIYLPAVPLFLMGGMALERLGARYAPSGLLRAVFFSLLVLYLIVLGRLSSEHATTFEDPLAEVKRYYLFPENELAPYERMRRDSQFAIYVDLPRGEFQKAEERAKKGLAAMPGSPIPYVALANIYADQGKWREVGSLLGPWVTPSRDFLLRQVESNRKLSTDMFTTYHIIPYFFGLAVAHVGRGRDAAELLCMSLKRGFDPNKVADALQEAWALTGPAKCLNAADKEGCLKKALHADFPEWRPRLDRDSCDRWRERFER